MAGVSHDLARPIQEERGGFDTAAMGCHSLFSDYLRKAQSKFNENTLMIRQKEKSSKGKENENCTSLSLQLASAQTVSEKSKKPRTQTDLFADPKRDEEVTRTLNTEKGGGRGKTPVFVSEPRAGTILI